MTQHESNLAASVAARLLNRAKQTGDDYQVLLTNFCFERFLHRLGESQARDQFVLKGAMLLRLWSDQPYRATRDLDLLRKGDGSFDAIRDDIRAICATQVKADAVVFEPGAIRLETIRAEDEYAGTRVILPARCGTARLALQIDLGLGDTVWPVPRRCAYPTLLDFPAPEVLAYPPEAVVAEKLEAMIVLGDRNSRIKAFFDLRHLASRFAFDRGHAGGGSSPDSGQTRDTDSDGDADRADGRLLGESLAPGPDARIRTSRGFAPPRFAGRRVRSARRLSGPDSWGPTPHGAARRDMAAWRTVVVNLTARCAGGQTEAVLTRKKTAPTPSVRA